MVEPKNNIYKLVKNEVLMKKKYKDKIDELRKQLTNANLKDKETISNRIRKVELSLREVENKVDKLYWKVPLTGETKNTSTLNIEKEIEKDIHNIDEEIEEIGDVIHHKNKFSKVTRNIVIAGISCAILGAGVLYYSNQKTTPVETNNTSAKQSSQPVQEKKEEQPSEKETKYVSYLLADATGDREEIYSVNKGEFKNFLMDVEKSHISLKDIDKEGKLYNNLLAYIKTYNPDLFGSSFITKIQDIGHFADNEDYPEVYKIYFDMQIKGGYSGMIDGSYINNLSNAGPAVYVNKKTLEIIDEDELGVPKELKNNISYKDFKLVQGDSNSQNNATIIVPKTEDISNKVKITEHK